ncbi:MAG: DUF2059 domain-containing protein [Jejuia sp.]
MKKIAIVIALFLAVSLQAQTVDATFKSEAIEFIKITGSGSMFEGAIDQIGAMVSQENKEAYKKEAMGTLDALYGELADIYMKEFTREEIQELLKFYRTDLGKKLASKQGSLTQQGMVIGQSWGMKVQGIAQKFN